MEVLDRHGKAISKGSHVVYEGTGTIGEVLDIKTQDKNTWVKMDTNDLWYNVNYIETIDKIKKEELEREEHMDTARKKVKKMKKTVGEDIDMSSELCDGGG